MGLYDPSSWERAFVATGTKTGVQTVTDFHDGTVYNVSIASGIVTPGAPTGGKTMPVYDMRVLGPGYVGFFDAETNQLINISTHDGKFYVAASSLKTNDAQGQFHGGYTAETKSKIINPKYLRRLVKVNPNDATQCIVEIGDVTNGVSCTCDLPNSVCDKNFTCGEPYFLRVDLTGTPSLRTFGHNFNRVFQANGGCCDGSVVSNVDPANIYLQWAEAINADMQMKDFIRAFVVVNGNTYAQDTATATALGLSGTFADIPAVLEALAEGVASKSGMIIQGAYVDTTFGNCSFMPDDYYGVEPIQVLASEVDLSGQNCTFETLCVHIAKKGTQANGLGEEKLRTVIMSESYGQNFFPTDTRMREVEQSTQLHNVIDRNTKYSSFFITHSVPRFNNPTGIFDNDQYRLNIIGVANTAAEGQPSNATADILDTAITAYLTVNAGTPDAVAVENASGTTATAYVFPEI